MSGRSNHVRRRLYALVAKIDLRLSAMMRHVNVHGKQDLPSGEMSVGRVVRFVELFVRKVRDHGGAVVEGIAQELDYRVLVGGRGQRRWRGILQTRTELVVVVAMCDINWPKSMDSGCGRNAY
jgi:hypothetical protein